VFARRWFGSTAVVAALSLGASVAVAGGTAAVAATPVADPSSSDSATSAAASPLASTTADPATLGQSAAARGLVSVASSWTQFDRTFTDPATGINTTVEGAAPLNRLDSHGQWVAIDDSLDADTTAGFAWRNTEDDYQVEFPNDLASGAVRVSHDGAWIDFRLSGASSNVGAVSGNTITYTDALPGVTIAYSATTVGLKESLSLASPASSSSFNFIVTTSAGLTRSTLSNGDTGLTSSKELVASLARPWVTDAKMDASGMFSAMRASVTPVAATSWQLGLSVDTTWLSSPDRAWPVLIDPTVYTTYATEADCLMFQGHPTTGFCPRTPSGVGYYGDDSLIRRDVMKFGGLTAIPSAATVLSSTLSIYQGETFYTANLTYITLQIYRNN
jgi:hypothetical protein